MSGSTDAATVAERTRLEAELREKQEALEDQYYDHAMDAQSKALDDEQEAFEKSKNDYIEELEKMLEDTKTIIANAILEVFGNADIVLTGVNEKAGEYGITLSEYLTNPWKTAAEKATQFKETADPTIQSMINEEGCITLFNTTATDKFTQAFGSGESAAIQFKKTVTDQIDAIKADIESENPLITKDLKDPWTDGENAANTFSEHTGTVLDALVTKAKTVAEDIGTYADSIIKDMKAAQDAIDRTGGQSPGGGGGGGGDEPPEDEKTIQGYNATAKWPGTGTAMITVQGSGKTKAAAEQDALNKLGTAYVKVKTAGGASELQVTKSWMDIKKYQKYKITSTPYYAKGTTGTTKDQWAITDEPQYGDELVLVPGKDGNLSYMRKGTAVIPADISENLMKLGMNPDFADMEGAVKNINLMTNYVNKPEIKLDIENFLHVDNVSQDTMPELKKFVKEQVNTMVKQLNYGLKRN